MRLKDFIDPQLVFTDVMADDRHHLNEIVVHLAGKHFPDMNEATLLADLDSQESVACMEGDCIIGVPNAFVPSLQQTICIVVRVVPESDPRTRQNTRVGFFVLSPPSKSMTHLRLIARITRFACHGSFCDDIVQITTPIELYQRLIQEDQRHV